MIVSNSELLKSFSRYLKLEKGASDNTIDGYLHDVVKLFQYVSPESKPTMTNSSMQTLRNLSVNYKTSAYNPGRRPASYRD